MIAKTARRVAVALIISIGVGFLILTPWRNHAAASTSSLFLRTIILGLSGTTAFAFFEVWPGKVTALLGPSGATPTPSGPFQFATLPLWLNNHDPERNGAAAA